MQFLKQEMDGVVLVQPNILSDERGSFSRIFCLKEFEKFGFKQNFVQANVSYNFKKGTFRGLHYQKNPYAEGKLVRCMNGAVLDIVLDLRPSSKTYLKTIQVELSQENQAALFIPEGCAHGFITLQDHSTVLYNHTAYYEPKSEAGVRYNDPAISLKLPFAPTTISLRDQSHPLIGADFKGYL